MKLMKYNSNLLCSLVYLDSAKKFVAAGDVQNALGNRAERLAIGSWSVRGTNSRAITECRRKPDACPVTLTLLTHSLTTRDIRHEKQLGSLLYRRLCVLPRFISQLQVPILGIRRVAGTVCLRQGHSLRLRDKRLYLR